MKHDGLTGFKSLPAFFPTLTPEPEFSAETLPKKYFYLGRILR